MERTQRLHIARRTTQIGFILLFLLLPVFDILRYDTVTKELFLFGKVWSLGLKEGFYVDGTLHGAGHVTLQFFLNAVLPWIIVLSIFPLLGLLFGRFFCGWLCPEGALFELAEFLNLKLLGRRNLYRKKPNDPEDAQGYRVVYGFIALFLLLTIPPLTGIFLSGYFIAPKTIWHEITTLQLSFGLKAGIIGVWIYMIVTSVFVRHVFCRYVCAPGLMQMLLGWVSPFSLRIHFDRKNYSKCTDCKACEKICFMGVKPRLPKKDINCVNCGECIIACKKELGDEHGLFGYDFGEKTVDRRGQMVSAKPACNRVRN